MNRELNPYQPPEPNMPFRPWWVRLWQVTFARFAPPPFARGRKVIVEGIAFYLDRKDKQRWFAASPSTISTDERLSLVVSEATRLLPVFLAENPRCAKHIEGRKLVIRLIAGYSDSPDRFHREITLGRHSADIAIDRIT